MKLTKIKIHECLKIIFYFGKRSDEIMNIEKTVKIELGIYPKKKTN